MNKKVIIGIIAGIVAFAFIVIAVVLGVTIASKINCKHDNQYEIEFFPYKAPTCQETGLTLGKKCNYCGKILVAQDTIDKIECKESGWIVDKESTATQNGSKHTECTVCGKIIKQETILSDSSSLEYKRYSSFVEVTGIGSYKKSELIIPSKYQGKYVKRIGIQAFYGCTSITSVIIPNSVTEIGGSAFSDCTRLKSVTIPNSVITISVGVFAGCKSLTTITIPNSVRSIGTGAFSSCTSLRTINYSGTIEQWNAIEKSEHWIGNVPATKVICSDGTVSLK